MHTKYLQFAVIEGMAVRDEEKRQAIFRLMDLNSDGKVEVGDLMEFINTFGPPLNASEEKKLLELAGLAGKEALDAKDIEALLTKEITLSTPKEEILNNFRVFDQTDTGVVGDHSPRSRWKCW